MTAHIYTTRIYYAHTDAGGVVYHATYLALAEQARTEALRDAGLSHEQMRHDHDCIFMVRRAEIAYLRPVRLDEILTITTTQDGLSGATITLRQGFLLAGGATAAELVVTLACVRAATGRPARIPAPWRRIPLCQSLP